MSAEEPAPNRGEEAERTARDVRVEGQETTSAPEGLIESEETVMGEILTEDPGDDNDDSVNDPDDLPKVTEDDVEDVDPHNDPDDDDDA